MLRIGAGLIIQECLLLVNRAKDECEKAPGEVGDAIDQHWDEEIRPIHPNSCLEPLFQRSQEDIKRHDPRRTLFHSNF